MIAEGYTRVTHLEYLDRGYYEFHKKLQNLGADIERIDETATHVLKDEELSTLFNG